MTIFKSEQSRKFIHTLSALGFAALPYFLGKEEIIYVAVLFLLVLIISRYFKLHGIDRSTLGELYFPIAVALSAYLFLPDNRLAFQFGILVLGLADAIAALVGKSWGHHRVSSLSNKTYEGSLAFFLVTFAIFLCLTFPLGITVILKGLLIALLLTAIESVSDWGLDNLFLPLIGAILLATLY